MRSSYDVTNRGRILSGFSEKILFFSSIAIKKEVGKTNEIHFLRKFNDNSENHPIYLILDYLTPTEKFTKSVELCEFDGTFL